MRFGYAATRATAQFLFHFGYGLEIHGIESIPRAGAVIIASNHRSTLDPPLLGSIIRREVHFFAKEELFSNPFTGAYLRYLNAFPVRRGRFDRTSLKYCLDLLAKDQALVFFPEGTRAPKSGFLRAKIGLGWVVGLSHAPVLPAYIHGSAEAKPRLRNRPNLSIVFGKPIPASELIPPDLRGHELYQTISDAVLERIRDLSLTTPNRRVKSRGILYDRDIIEEERLR